MNKITFLLYFFINFIFFQISNAQGSGNALSFNGSNTDVTIQNNSSIVDANTLSYELWFNPSSLGGNKQMIGKSVHGGGVSRAQMGIWLDGNQLVARAVRTSDPTGLDITHNGIQQNRWYHVAAVYGGTFFRLYLNGELVASTTFAARSLAVNSDPLKIGCDFQRCGGDGMNYTFNGIIDEVRIWKKALSLTEIRENMTKRLTGSEVGLGGYWRLDEGIGAVVVDATSNSDNGTFSTNPPSWQISGAAIGDSSDFFYNANLNGPYSHTSNQGDSFTVDNFTGNPRGVHIYSVDSAPNTDQGTAKLNNNEHYFGVFVVGDFNSQFNATYNYSNNPAFLEIQSSIDVEEIKLFVRNQNNILSWTNSNATQNIGANTVSSSNIYRQEYYLALFQYIFETAGDWETNTNWSDNLLPPSLGSVLITAGPTVNSNRSVFNIEVQGGVNVEIENGSDIEISGNLANFGSFSGEGEVVLNGTSAQSISGGGSFENLRLNNATSVGLNDPSDLFGVLYADQGTLNTGGNLSLKCDFGTGKTAQLAAVNGAIVGNVTVEQCYPARRAFRLVSSSVTSTSIRENWQEDPANFEDNPRPGYGTHITGLSPGAPNADENDDGDDGFDYNPSGNPSMYTFDNVEREWINVPATNVALEGGKPYRLLIRGDRSIDIRFNDSEPTDTRLSATGTLNVGDFTFNELSSVEDEFNFIGNPYQAQVSVEALVAGSTNLKGLEYSVWDPTLGGAPTPGIPGGRGAYVTVDLVDGSATVGSSATKYLQPMQAAFIRTGGAGVTPVVNFQESMKAVNQAQTETKSLNELESIKIKLFTAASFAQGNTPSDGLIINFNEAYSTTVKDDSPKLGNLDENFARLVGGKKVSIERRPLPEATEELELSINQYRKTSYVMEFDMTGGLNSKVFVKDNYLDEVTEVTITNKTYSFEVNSSVPESIAEDRFSLVFEPISLSTVEENSADVRLYPNPTKGNFSIQGIDLGQDTEVEIYNMIGQQVYKRKLGNQSSVEVTDFRANAGIYLVKLKTNEGERTFKLIKE